MIGSSGAVLGIDVGSSPTRRSSAVCRLVWDDQYVDWSISRFRAIEPERTTTILQVAGTARLEAVAFDGPLRRGLDLIGRYRTAERLLTRRLQPLIGKPGQSSAPVGKILNTHANACARIVLDGCRVADARHETAIHQMAIVEAFPSSFLGVMIEDPSAIQTRRGDRSDVFFQHAAAAGTFDRLVAHLLPGRTLARSPATITNHDDRAALVCAFTALAVATGDYLAVGDEDGWIVLPPPAFVRSWAQQALTANEQDLGKIAIYHPGRAAV